jgi:hypothetical protein
VEVTIPVARECAVRLQMILPRVEPDQIPTPTACPHRDCTSAHLRPHQYVPKPLLDSHFDRVVAVRYHCLGCGRTFRVYPQGVDHCPTSQRTRGLGVMLYLLGLSYGATSLALEALGVYMAKSSVYQAVQAAAERLGALRHGALLSDVRTPALGADLTYVKCRGEWLPVGLMVDAVAGTVLCIDLLEREDAEALREWIAPVAAALGVELLVSDDADALKGVADVLDMEHQVCKTHVARNTEELVSQMREVVEGDADGSLRAIGISPGQVLADLAELLELVGTRRPEDLGRLEALHLRYVQAPAPYPGEAVSLAYRLRMLTLDRWELWPRLTRYREWVGPGGERVDGTNNACERAIGWWVKERYRTMRSYKRRRSVLNVSRLIAWCGNRLDRGGVDLAELVA